MKYLQKKTDEAGKVENSSVIFSGKFEVTDVDTDIIQELYKKNASESVEFLGEHLFNNGFYVLKTLKSKNIPEKGHFTLNNFEICLYVLSKHYFKKN